MMSRDKDGYLVKQSPFIADLLAQAQAKAEAEADFLLIAIYQRFREFPPELASSIRACVNSEILARWLRIALGARSVEQFRQEAGL
jgi:hypothetical protein